VVGGWIQCSAVAGTRLDPTLECVLATAWDVKDDLDEPVVAKLELPLCGIHDLDEGDEALDITTGALVICSRHRDRSRFRLRGLP
jgi:hypothetical protein